MIVFIGGCMPSKEAKTAGQIGCAPDEITISSEESQFGLIQSGETWVAECQGRKFVCSQINQSGGHTGLFDRSLASEQVSCREAVESQEAERRRNAHASEAVERANRRVYVAPTGAAGFDFGESPEDAARRCEAAGQAWGNGNANGDGNPGCSGPAAPLGIAARIDFEFCSGRACSITVEHVPHDNWSRSSVSLKANLESKYGPAQEASGSVPENCRSEAAFARCLESRQVDLRYRWRWAAGESIEMSVGKSNETANPAIRLVYRRPAGSANSSAL